MKRTTIILISILLLLGMLGAAFIVARPYISLSHVEPLVVKGFAEIPLVSDRAVATAAITVMDADLPTAYGRAVEQLEQLRELVTAHLGNSAKLTELNVGISSVAKKSPNGTPLNQLDYYVVVRNLRIESVDVHAMSRLVPAIFDLNTAGVRASVSGPEYYVSNLESAKVELAKLATQNGVERARAIAENADAHLGRLVSAQQGVIQITKPNSADTSSWGIYDTGTIDKAAKLVVTLEFEIK